MKKIILLIVICLATDAAIAQGRLWGGISAGTGQEWYINKDRNNKSRSEIEHLGLTFKYNLNDRLAVRTGINYVNKRFDVFELPIGAEYALIKNNKIDLVLSSGIKMNKSTNNLHEYLDSGCWSRNDTIFGDVGGRTINSPIHITFYNGIHGRVANQFDLGITLNSGFYNFIELRDERYIIKDCGDAKKLEEGFMDHPDRIFRNSYLSLNFTYWIRRQDDEKRQQVKDLGLNDKNVLYAEVTGTLFNASVNYERIVATTVKENFNARVSLRAGIAVTRDGNELITGLSLLYGKNGHYAELGAGIVRWEHKYGNFGYRYQKGELFGKAGVYYVLEPNYYNEEGHKGTFYPGLGIGVVL